jgi:aminopeptidase C
MNPRSAKNKGQRFEKYLVQKLRETLDVNTHLQPASGSGLEKNDIRIPAFNVEVEAKNAAKFNLVADWQQTKNQKTSGNMAVLAIRNPQLPEFQETLIVIELNEFIGLLQDTQSSRQVSYSADPKAKYALQRLVEAAKSVLKTFDK